MSAVLPALTIGEIARRESQPVHRIAYVIRSRGIRPSFRAGNARIFSTADADYISSELKRISAERQPEAAR